MKSATTQRARKATVEETVALAKERLLPSGHSVIVRLADGAEELEVRSPAGEVEVRITLSDAGPVVRLTGARLELEAIDSLDVTCERFQVNAATGLTLRSAGDVQVAGQEMRVQTRKDIHLNGEIIRLNCAESADVVSIPEPLTSDS